MYGKILESLLQKDYHKVLKILYDNQITINNSKLNNGEKLIKNILKLFSPLL